MNLVIAIKVLFGETAPAGADFEGAFNALKGKKAEDLSKADQNTLDALAETFQDFGDDPSGWLKKAPAADPRHSWWVKLAQALGASVTSGPAQVSATPSSSPVVVASPDSTDPVVPEPEPEQGIDPDALSGGAPPPGRREGGEGGGGGSVIVTGIGAGDDRPRRERKKRADRRDRDEDEEEDDREDRPPRRERKPPEPPPKPRPLIDVADRSIPAITREILTYGSYRTWSAWLIVAFRLIRTGSPAEQTKKQAELPHIRPLIQSMKNTGDRMEVQAAFHLERLIDALEAGRDQSEPAWFQANYVTGTYAD